MRSLQLRAHVDAQGAVILTMPPDVADREVDLVVVFEPVAVTSPTNEKKPAQGWPPGFFERTAGAWQGEPLTRESQGEYEQRDLLE